MKLIRSKVVQKRRRLGKYIMIFETGNGQIKGLKVEHANPFDALSEALDVAHARGWRYINVIRDREAELKR